MEVVIMFRSAAILSFFPIVTLLLSPTSLAAEDASGVATCKARYYTGYMEKPDGIGGASRASGSLSVIMQSAGSTITNTGSWPSKNGADHSLTPSANRDRFSENDPNPIKVVAENPVSTFSSDVDTASYAFVRNQIKQQGRLPQADAVRPEEFINVFNYGYNSPENLKEAFRPDIAVFQAPWNADKQLLRIGIKAYEIPREQRPSANLIFLLDVSGSMSALNKLPLVKASICMLLDELKSDDTVSLVVYAGVVGLVLSPTRISEKETVLNALDRLNPRGSTAGGKGIELAYSVARDNFIKDAVNRVILATDGDFNVGINNPRALRDFVARKRETGIFLTVLGFGTGNYNDELMQALAQDGNGIAAYIDSIDEAYRVLVRNLSGTMIVVAKDVKFQIEFNPHRVAEYRLIGYETRLLERTDFNNDQVDAGDIGAGHTVTAIYELSMVGSPGHAADPFRYGDKDTNKSNMSVEVAFLRLRFKAPDSDESRLIEQAITDENMAKVAPENARFAAAVVWFAEVLRNSSHVNKDWKAIIKLAEGAMSVDPYGERRGLIKLIKIASEHDK
jgi:Ca-activated chloride channel homolog